MSPSGNELGSLLGRSVCEINYKEDVLPLHFLFCSQAWRGSYDISTIEDAGEGKLKVSFFYNDNTVLEEIVDSNDVERFVTFG